jgi:hypothetical protein
MSTWMSLSLVGLQSTSFTAACGIVSLISQLSLSQHWRKFMKSIKWAMPRLSQTHALPLILFLPTVKSSVEWVKWSRLHAVSSIPWITSKLTTLDAIFLSSWRMLNKLFIESVPRTLWWWVTVNWTGHVQRHGLECSTDLHVGQVVNLFTFFTISRDCCCYDETLPRRSSSTSHRFHSWEHRRNSIHWSTQGRIQGHRFGRYSSCDLLVGGRLCCRDSRD